MPNIKPSILAFQNAAEYASLPDFDVDAHLDSRAQKLDLVVVEIGHGATPIAANHEDLIDNRAYVGIEAWLRDPINVKRKCLADQRPVFDQQNIFFIGHQLLGEVVRERQGEEGESWYEGEYNAETILPDGSADEVVFSNVFGDPHVAHSVDRPKLLLEEAHRLHSGEGLIVIRDTIKPYRTRLSRKVVEDSGLSPVGFVTPEDEQRWDRLEVVYDGEKNTFMPTESASYYLMLASS